MSYQSYAYGYGSNQRDAFCKSTGINEMTKTELSMWQDKGLYPLNSVVESITSGSEHGFVATIVDFYMIVSWGQVPLLEQNTDGTIRYSSLVQSIFNLKDFKEISLKTIKEEEYEYQEQLYRRNQGIAGAVVGTLLGGAPGAIVGGMASTMNREYVPTKKVTHSGKKLYYELSAVSNANRKAILYSFEIDTEKRRPISCDKFNGNVAKAIKRSKEFSDNDKLQYLRERRRIAEENYQKTIKKARPKV